MSDLIDREAVREFIKSYRNSTDVAFHMEDHLDEIPTASPWHRVEDGLPDKYTQCLVADADGKCAVGYYRYDCEAWDSPAFGWIENENRIYIDDIPMGIGKVVAWMPLPDRRRRKTMEVVEKKPVPIYEVKCHECKSRIRYKACEVSWSHITCPVCGVSLWASTIYAVDYEPPNEDA